MSEAPSSQNDGAVSGDGGEQLVQRPGPAPATGGFQFAAAADGENPVPDLSAVDPSNFGLSDLASCVVADLRRYVVASLLVRGTTTQELTAAAQRMPERTLRSIAIQHFVDDRIGDIRARDAVQHRNIRAHDAAERRQRDESAHVERLQISAIQEELAVQVAELSQQLSARIDDIQTNDTAELRRRDAGLARSDAIFDGQQLSTLQEELAAQIADLRQERELLNAELRVGPPRRREPHTGRPLFEPTTTVRSPRSTTPLFTPNPAVNRTPAAMINSDTPIQYALTPGHAPGGKADWVPPDLDRSGESLLARSVRPPDWGRIDSQGRLTHDGSAKVQSGAFMLFFRDLCRYLSFLKLGGVLEDVAGATGSLPPGIGRSDAQVAERNGSLQTLCHEARMCMPERLHPLAANCFLCSAFTRPIFSPLHLICSHLEQRCSW